MEKILNIFEKEPKRITDVSWIIKLINTLWYIFFNKINKINKRLKVKFRMFLVCFLLFFL
jgi:hypothetical protein